MVTIGRLANADGVYLGDTFEHFGEGNTHVDGTLQRQGVDRGVARETATVVK